MTVKEALKTSGLILASLSTIVLFYFVSEPVTEFFDESDLPVLAMLSNLSLAVIIYFFVRWFNKKANGLNASDYGFDNRRLLPFFLTGVFVAILLVGSTLAYFFVTGKIDFVPLSDSTALISFLLGTLMVAAWEEFYFRGLVVPTLLKQNLSFKWTAIISSAVFAFLHIFSYDLATITPFWFFGVFFFTTILLFLYIKTRSIWTSIGCHFCWDTIFGAIGESENEFGVVRMETYELNAELIDNLSIVITFLFLLAFLVIMRNQLKFWVRAYISAINPTLP